MCYYYINWLLATLHSRCCCTTLKLLWAITGTLVMFVFLFFPPLALVSWIDFPFVLNSRDAVLISVLRRLFHSSQRVCLRWHSSIPFSTQEDPLRPGISQHLLLVHHPRDGPGKHLISYPNTQVCLHVHTRTNTHTHMQTQRHICTHTHTHCKPPCPHSIHAPVSHCSKSS